MTPDGLFHWPMWKTFFFFSPKLLGRWLDQTSTPQCHGITLTNQINIRSACWWIRLSVLFLWGNPCHFWYNLCSFDAYSLGTKIVKQWLLALVGTPEWRLLALSGKALYPHPLFPKDMDVARSQKKTNRSILWYQRHPLSVPLKMVTNQFLWHDKAGHKHSLLMFRKGDLGLALKEKKTLLWLGKHDGLV